jgi:hypothetical protein
MYRLCFISIILISIAGCATSPERPFTENNYTDAVLDADILVMVSQGQILGTVNEASVDQTTINIENQYGGPFGIFIGGLLDAYMTSKDIQRMNELVKPVQQRVVDLDFRKDLVHALREKCIFTTPERITLVNETPEQKEDVLKLIKKAGNTPTIVVSARYAFNANYRVFMIDAAVSIWLDKLDAPVYSANTSYYSPPITPFKKTYSPSLGTAFGKALLLQAKEDIEEKLYVPNISLWADDNAAKYRQYYSEGIDESANLIVYALLNKQDRLSVEEKKIAPFVDFHRLQKNVREGRLIKSENNREMILTANGAFSSVYNGPLKERIRK